jgi:hypothetical protein
MLEKINKLKSWQVIAVIIILGFAVYFTGLNTPFQGDDYPQIVNNIPVHSIKNIRIFFEGGTIYRGHGIAQLSGVYFRPLMTSAFSLIYTIFGPHPVYFHLLQFLLCIGSAILFYLFLRYSFKPALSLFLSLILLVHPIDSETVFSIPVTQDALYFFFGILALYLLLRFKTTRSLIGVALCLLLSLLSKETGVIFLVMAAIYLFWWDRRRLLSFFGLMAVPIIVYLALRIHAIGLLGSNPHVAPIDQISLLGRIMTAPGIMQFYLFRFIFPWKLAFAYYWVYPHFSIEKVLLPILFDLAFVALVIYGAIRLHSKASKASYCTYLFFAIWLALSFVLILQIFPLDETASESWFYVSMVGLLGMLGVFLNELKIRINPIYLVIVAVLVIGILGIRTAVRGLDYKNQTTLAYHDIKDSKEDYVADNIIATDLFNKKQYAPAKIYAERSIAVFPYGPALDSLGTIDFNTGNYPQSNKAYMAALKYGGTEQLYQNISTLFLYYGKPSSNINFIEQAIGTYPQDPILRLNLALLEYQSGDFVSAKEDITQAYSLSSEAEIASAYSAIMSNEKLKLIVPR